MVLIRRYNVTREYFIPNMIKSDNQPEFDRSNWPLPDDFLLELGRLASLWTTLEAQLDICIGKLAGFDDLNDPKPFILLHHSSVRQKLDMFSSLCEHQLVHHPHLRKYKEVVSKITAAQTSRNRFVHNGMVKSEDGKSVEMALGSAREIIKTSVRTVNIKEIKKVSVDIADAMRSLHHLVTGHDRPPFWETGPRA